jgi:hypothetical protein
MNYTTYRLCELDKNPDILYYDIEGEYDTLELAIESKNMLLSDWPDAIYKICKITYEIIE